MNALATTHHSEHGLLPLEPIDAPKSWFVRLLFTTVRRRYGKVPMALRVLYSRSTPIALASMVIGVVLEAFLRIEPSLRLMLQIATSSQNGCTFCADLMLAEVLLKRLGRERFTELADFEQSTHFSDREKAALAYAYALCNSLHVGDEVWTRLGKFFSERERIEIVWVCAVERYYNSMALPLRMGSDELASAVTAVPERTASVAH